VTLLEVVLLRAGLPARSLGLPLPVVSKGAKFKPLSVRGVIDDRPDVEAFPQVHKKEYARRRYYERKQQAAP
jgi:hypothetical protein